MTDKFQPLRVEAQRSELGVCEPEAFSLGVRRIEVVEILDRWLATDHDYFKLSTREGISILRHDEGKDHWALTLFKRSDSWPGGDVGGKPRMH